MAYGKIKADTFVYDNSGSDVEVTLASLGNKADLASPTFTGTVTIPTPSSGDNSTKAASTAFVVAGFTAKPASAGTVAASEVVQVDANKDITGFRNVTLSGDLTVNGTTTTIDSTTLTVEDKNIELGKVDTPTDTTADGGGITLKGATDKTFNWVDATDAWTSSENIHIKIATGNTRLRVHSDTTSSPAPGIELMRGTNDTFGADAYTDWSIINSGSNLTVSSAWNGSTTERFNINPSTGATTFSGSISDSKGDVRKIPQNSQSSAYTLVASDAGKHVITDSAVTIPNSVFAAGDAVTIVNNSGSDIALTKSITNLYLSTDGSNASRTLAARGTATILFVSGTAGYISGAGLS